MGKAVQMLWPQANQEQQFHSTLGAGPGVQPHDTPMHDQWLRHDVVHRHARVERGLRILENNLDPRAQLPQGRCCQTAKVFPFKQNAALGRGFELQDAAGKRGLARARLADQAEAFTLLHRQRHLSQGLHRRGPGPATPVAWVDFADALKL